MTDILVLVREGTLTGKRMHWKEAMQMLKEVDAFTGVPLEVLFIDKDEKKVLSAQQCFRLSDVAGYEALLKQYSYEECL